MAGDRTLRVLVRGSVRARVGLGLIVAAWFALAVMVPGTLPGTLWVGPAGPALAVAVLALVGGAALSRRAPMPDDPLSAPLTDSPPRNLAPLRPW